MFPQLPKKSIAFKVPEASDEAIDIIDQMLQFNPKDRPDVKTILQHPYFTRSPEPSPKAMNPFTSPVGTPERQDSFSNSNFFTEPGFGGENAPSFGHNLKTDSPNRQMESSNSPLSGNDFMHAHNSSSKKPKSVLNEGDGLPMDPKYSYSSDKSINSKKAKSQ